MKLLISGLMLLFFVSCSKTTEPKLPNTVETPSYLQIAFVSETTTLYKFSLMCNECENAIGYTFEYERNGTWYTISSQAENQCTWNIEKTYIDTGAITRLRVRAFSSDDQSDWFTRSL